MRARARLATLAVLTLASAAKAAPPQSGGASSDAQRAPDLLPPSPFEKGQQPQKLTPPPPPPWDQPLSTSGVDVTAPRATEPASGAPRDHLMKHMRDLERRVAELERARRERAEPTPWVDWLRPSLLLQPQLIWNFYNAAASPNAQNGVLPPGIGSNDVTATPSGNTTNPDFFRLRRARLKLDFLPSEYARFVMEIEPVPRDPTVPGSGTIARQIEAIARFPITEPTAFEVGAGSFEVPFGGEWRENHGDRPFIERSWFQQNLFPGDFDLGAHVTMNTRHVEAELAMINGRTFGELDQGGNLDLNRAKDGVATVRFDAGGFEAGLSGYAGEGQLVDAQNLRFKQYGRFAADLDLSFKERLRLGLFRAFGEVVYGTNMDRGVLAPGNLPVMPADLGQDVTNRDELGLLVRIDQEFGRWLAFGVRYDYYSPDVNLANDGRHTIGVVGALRLLRDMHVMEDRIAPSVQVNLEYDHAIDTIRPSGPEGATKQIDMLSVVLQGRL